MYTQKEFVKLVRQKKGLGEQYVNESDEFVLKDILNKYPEYRIQIYDLGTDMGPGTLESIGNWTVQTGKKFGTGVVNLANDVSNVWTGNSDSWFDFQKNKESGQYEGGLFKRTIDEVGDRIDTVMQGAEARANEQVASGDTSTWTTIKNIGKTTYDIAGNIVGGASSILGDAVMSAGKTVITDETQNNIKNYVAETISEYDTLNNLATWYETEYLPTLEQMRVDDPAAYSSFKATTGLLEGILDLAGGKIVEQGAKAGIKGVTNGVKNISKNMVKQAENVVNNVKNNNIYKNAAQKVGAVTNKINDRFGNVGASINNTINNFKTADDKLTYIKEQVDNVIKPGKDLDGTIKEVFNAMDDYEVNSIKNTLKNLDTQNVKTYKDFYDLLDNEIKTLSRQQDDLLSKYTQTYNLNDLITKTNNGKTQVNYVDNAIKQMESLYSKTNDIEGLNRIGKWIGKTEFTIKELNDLSREYGNIFKNKAYNVKGDPKLGDIAVSYENIRKGLKNLVDNKLESNASSKYNQQLHYAYKSKEKVGEIVEKVQKLANKVENRGVLEKVGNYIGDTLDLLSGGLIKGFLSRLIPRNAGLKTLNHLDLEEKLASSLKRINTLLEKGDKMPNDKFAYEVADLVKNKTQSKKTPKKQTKKTEETKKQETKTPKKEEKVEKKEEKTEKAKSEEKNTTKNDAESKETKKNDTKQAKEKNEAKNDEKDAKKSDTEKKQVETKKYNNTGEIYNDLDKIRKEIKGELETKKKKERAVLSRKFEELQKIENKTEAQGIELRKTAEKLNSLENKYENLVEKELKIRGKDLFEQKAKLDQEWRKKMNDILDGKNKTYTLDEVFKNKGDDLLNDHIKQLEYYYKYRAKKVPENIEAKVKTIQKIADESNIPTDKYINTENLVTTKGFAEYLDLMLDDKQIKSLSKALDDATENFKKLTDDEMLDYFTQEELIDFKNIKNKEIKKIIEQINILRANSKSGYNFNGGDIDDVLENIVYGYKDLVTKWKKGDFKEMLEGVRVDGKRYFIDDTVAKEDLLKTFTSDDIDELLKMTKENWELPVTEINVRAKGSRFGNGGEVRRENIAKMRKYLEDNAKDEIEAGKTLGKEVLEKHKQELRERALKQRQSIEKYYNKEHLDNLIKQTKEKNEAPRLQELKDGFKNVDDINDTRLASVERVIYEESGYNGYNRSNLRTLYREIYYRTPIGKISINDVAKRKDFQKQYKKIMESDTIQDFVKKDYNTVLKLLDDPEAEVIIYRGMPRNEWNYGDWVTLSPEYASQYGKVFSKKVKAKELKLALDPKTGDGNAFLEFGYYPEGVKPPKRGNKYFQNMADEFRSRYKNIATENIDNITNKEASEIIDKIFKGKMKYDFVDSIKTPEGLKALGEYSDNLIKFVNNPKKNVVYHEALHGYFDLALGKQRKRILLDEIKKQRKFKSDIDAEEWLADSFSLWAMGREVTGISTGIKKVLSDLWYNLKKIFGGKTSKVDELFREIEKVGQGKREFRMVGENSGEVNYFVENKKNPIKIEKKVFEALQEKLKTKGKIEIDNRKQINAITKLAEANDIKIKDMGKAWQGDAQKMYDEGNIVYYKRLGEWNGWGYTSDPYTLWIDNKTMKKLIGKTDDNVKIKKDAVYKSDEEKMEAWAKRLAKLTGIDIEDARVIAKEKIDYKWEKILEKENEQATRYSTRRQTLINKMTRENPLRRIEDEEHAQRILQASNRHNFTGYEAFLDEARELADLGEIDRSEVREWARRKVREQMNN